MKQFITRLLLFLLPLIVLLYAGDAFISKNLRKSNLGANSVWRDLFDGKVNADIVIYGASRAWQHIDPQLITDSLKKSAYNLGLQAYDFRMQYLRHLLLLKYNKKPQLIILSVDFLTFQKRTDLYDPSQFLPYMLYDNLVKNYTIDYKGYTWFDYEIPLVRYYGQENYIHRALTEFTRKTPAIPELNKGYMSYNMQYTNVFADGSARHKSYEIPFDTTTIELFDHFLASCKKDNIKVIFVYSPEYIAGQKFVSNRTQLFNMVHQFGKKYNIPLLDYSADTMCYKKAYFYNSEHLNTTGAELFSKKFAGDLKGVIDKGPIK